MLNNYNGNLLNNMGAMNNPRARFGKAGMFDLLNQNFWRTCHVLHEDNGFGAEKTERTCYFQVCALACFFLSLLVKYTNPEAQDHRMIVENY